MDLEVVGRHALFFDDDAMASFVNSGDALVDWHSLQIDRYDVRHLLAAPPPPRRRSRNSQHLFADDPALESQLDHERYLDLPSTPDQPEVEEDEKPMSAGGYHSVAFSYGNTDDSSDQRNADAGLESAGFFPPFPVPQTLSQSLPPTEKLHQIIARTAMFVSRHGGQSEIVLRVKQGDNPTFGFLMPDHHLHAYFRYLVDHPELLHSEVDENSQNEGKKAGNGSNDLNSTGGALSLLGSVYGEEEDGDDTAKSGKEVTGQTTDAVETISRGLERTESGADAADKDGQVSKNPLSNKSKVLAVKKNSSIGGTKKKVDQGSVSIAAEKSKGSVIGVASKVEPLVVEPPSDLKRLVDKIVELIAKHGRQFEATLLEQDCNRERFSFLVPSNQYHPYYLQVLQKARESKANGKGFHFGKDDPVGRGMEKKASSLKEADSPSSGLDVPFEFDKKEKFKMTLGKSKKDAQETESRGSQPEFSVAVDAASAAAILQAATRGIKNPNLGIISNMPLNANRSSASEDNETKTIARTTASEADSSEAFLTKEQKLKAERLKRAKMFVSMLKSGAVPSKTGTSRGSSLEPQELGLDKSAGEVNLTGKQQEDSSGLVDVDKLDVDEKPQKDKFSEEHNERVSRRKYRSRRGDHKDEDKDSDDNGEKMERDEGNTRRMHRSRSGRYKDRHFSEDGEKSEEEKRHRHSKRKHRSHSSHQEEDDYEDSDREEKDHKRSKKKHRERSGKRHSSRRSSHEEEDEHDKEEKMHHTHTEKKHRSHHSSRHRRHSRRHKERHSSVDKESRDYTEDDSSSDKHNKVSYREREELEEGEISSKASDDSRRTAGRETSLGVSNVFQRASSQPVQAVTEVSDDLRAKIRAMLLATR